MTTVGQRNTLILAALIKRLAMLPGVKPNEQLRLLEQLDGMSGGDHTSPEQIAAIDPACDLQLKIIDEAMALDGAAKTGHLPSFKILGSVRVFEHFVKLNAGLRAALEWRYIPANEPSAPEIEPVGSSLVSYSEAVATSIPPKSPPLRNRPPIAPARGPWCHDEAWGQTT